MKKKIEVWLYNLVKPFYNKKECNIYVKTYIEDEVAFKYLKNEFINYKKNFESNLTKSIKKTQLLENKKVQNQDNYRYNLRVKY